MVKTMNEPTYPLHEPAFFRGIDLERMLAG
jgi:hypothetical protein